MPVLLISGMKRKAHRTLPRAGPAASFTIEHILAADRLRRLADAVAIGFTGRRDMVPIQSITYGLIRKPISRK